MNIFRFTIYLSSMLAVCFQHPAFCRQSKTKEDSIVQGNNDTTRNFRINPQTGIYRMDYKKISKHRISVKRAMKYIGKEKAVDGEIFSCSQENGFVNAYMGNSFPNHLLLVTLTGSCQVLADRIRGRKIRVIGMILSYKSKPAIMVSDMEQIVFL